MKMKHVLTAILIVACIETASAKLLLDSIYTDPTSIEAGDNVKVYVKYHEATTTWKLASIPTASGEKQPIGEDSNAYYVGRILASDDISQRYMLLKKSERDVGHLFLGESWTTPFEVTVGDEAPATTYTMEFQMLRTNLDKTAPPEVVLSSKFNITVEGDPKFTIDSDSQLTAGKTENFTVSVTNVGGGVAKQVTVELNESSPLTVLKSSSVYLGDMSGKLSRSLVYELYVDSTASPKAYTIPAEIKYTDRDGTVNTISKTLGVKVQGVPMVAANLNSFDDMMAGSTGKVSVSVINKGFVDAKFLSIQVLDTKDYTVTSNTDVYIGNLASDDFETEEFTIKIAGGVSGKIPLKVKVTYTEENNNQMHVEDEDLELNVLPEDEYYRLHPKTNGTQQITSIAMAIPLLIVGYIVLWLLFKIVGAITGLIDRKIFKKV